MFHVSYIGKYCDQGDDGGPIIVKGVLVGVTIGSYGCADPKYAEVYVRITAYVNWIKTMMTNNPG
jgi:trypsin